MIKIGVIGTGYWGKHHLRILKDLPCELIGIADIDLTKASLAKEFDISYFSDYKKLLKKVEAVTIVTPASTHFEIAKKAIRKGKHVLVEKPFVLRKEEAKKLEKLASENDVRVMVGHTYLYHPAISKIKELMENGHLGNVYYFLMQWLNLGIIRSDVNALWNFAPHPFSIIHHLTGEMPVSISASGRDFIQKGIEDIVFLTMNFGNGVISQMNFSWLHPVKVREVTVVGSKKLAVFNDTDPISPLKIYDKGISPEEYKTAMNWNNFAEFKSKVRFGSVEIPKLPEIEPLKAELEDFINAISGNKEPISNIKSGKAVVSMLTASSKSISRGGNSIYVKE